MHSQTTVLLKTSVFEAGVFRAVSSTPGELRRSVALSHLLAIPRTACAIQQAGRSEQITTPARAVFYNQGCEYTARSVCSLREVTHFVRVPWEILADAIRPHDPSVDERRERPLGFSDAPLSDGVFLELSRLMRAAASKAIDPKRADETLRRAVHAVIAGAYAERSARPPARQGVRDDEYVRSTQELLSLSFRETIGLAEIARRVGVSPFHLSRVFKRRVGMTTTGFRDCLRLRAAIDELAESREEVEPIAERLGYPSPSHFAEEFRRRFGFSPLRARTMLRSSVLHPAGH